MGLFNVMAAAAQLFLSGIPGSTNPPVGGAAAIARVAEIFFASSVSLACFTRTDWHWNEPKTADVATPSFRNLLAFTTLAALADSTLGTQTQPSVFPHLLGGCIVTLCALWALEIALNKFSQIPNLKIPAILLAELTGLQLFLGLVVHSMELNARATSLPMPGLTVINATHDAVGALVLVASVYAAFQAFKYLANHSANSVAPISSETKMKAYDPE